MLHIRFQQRMDPIPIRIHHLENMNPILVYIGGKAFGYLTCDFDYSLFQHIVDRTEIAVKSLSGNAGLLTKLCDFDLFVFFFLDQQIERLEQSFPSNTS